MQLTRMRFRERALVVGLMSLLGAGSASAAVTLGQIDTFEDATVQGWLVGLPHPAPPSVIATGGPTGADDAFLQVRSFSGGGPGSRLAIFNTAQWTGDFVAAGVSAISFDLRNFGPSDAVLRLRLMDEVAGAFNVAQTPSITVPAGGGWSTHTFSLRPADLLPVLGDVSLAVQNVREFRLWHKPSATSVHPPSVVMTLGVDNIRAIPEPGSVALIAITGAVLVRRRRG